MTDTINTHISARVPGPEHHFLINAYGLMFDEITASSLVKVDLEGNIIEDITGYGINPAGFVIHSAVHAARDDARCVMHTHTRDGLAVSAQKHGLLPLTQHAMRYWNRVAYDEHYCGVALSAAEGDRMCRALGDKDILFLRNHGVIVSGPTVARAYDDLYYLERTAMVQVLAMQTGRPLHTIDEALAEHTHRQIAADTELAELHFQSLKRLLDRDEPGWRRSSA